MLTTAGGTEDAEGVERTQSDERGRTTLTEDAERWVRFANAPPDADNPIILTPIEDGLHVRAA